jgi:hypothetical protein
MTKRAGLAALAAVALAVAGCGGDDGDGDDGLTRAELVRRADRACVASDLRPVTAPNDVRHAAELTADEARARRDLQVELERLDPSDEVERDYEAFLANSRQVIAKLDRMTALARRDQRAELARVEIERIALLEERERLADRIGFERCARPFSREERERAAP